jgi:hypothetical protein
MYELKNIDLFQMKGFLVLGDSLVACLRRFRSSWRLVEGVRLLGVGGATACPGKEGPASGIAGRRHDLVQSHLFEYWLVFNLVLFISTLKTN